VQVRSSQPFHSSSQPSNFSRRYIHTTTRTIDCSVAIESRVFLRTELCFASTRDVRDETPIFKKEYLPQMKRAVFFIFLLLSTLVLAAQTARVVRRPRAMAITGGSTHQVALTWNDTTPGVTFNIYRGTVKRRRNSLCHRAAVRELRRYERRRWNDVLVLRNGRPRRRRIRRVERGQRRGSQQSSSAVWFDGYECQMKTLLVVLLLMGSASPSTSAHSVSLARNPCTYAKGVTIRVWRQKNQNAWAQVHQLSNTATAWTDANVVAGAKYTYYLLACDLKTLNCSAASNVVSVTVP